MHLGASRVKWTTHDPCLVLSETELILYTNFEVCDEKNHRHFKNILRTNLLIMITKKIPRNVYIF